MSEIKLKPCPFCGGMPVIKRLGENTEFESYGIMCSNPHCMAETSQWNALEEAVKTWNLRVFEI